MSSNQNLENSIKREKQFEFLKEAINDTQNTIRFIDSKASAVIVLWSIVITALVSTYSKWIEWLRQFYKNEGHLEILFITLILLGMAICFILSLLLVYRTLLPNNSPVEHLKLNEVNLKENYFISSTDNKMSFFDLFRRNPKIKLRKPTKEFILDIKQLTDEQIIEEMAIELQKVSAIRLIKLQRVNKGIFFFLIFIALLTTLIVYSLISNFIQVTNFRFFGISVNVELFIYLYLGHKIGDYLLQSDKQAKSKQNSWYYLLVHCAIYSLSVIAIPFIFMGYFNLAALFFVFITHVVIDQGALLRFWMKYIKGIKDPDTEEVTMVKLEIDQTFHYIVIGIISILG
ncbi:hypothetical protein BRO54_3799 [Geobacillus proteiniphilus]|uniref:Pycsar effector protein domain-containing protein n=2 Tax=Geobacillus TaxID=129337 RepID=A0A1Q5SIE3_9BACL|nr:DUF3307 domain-containing protein [Geobacillus proteiniphilus]OKO87772.1 hypothetical protein BRO54_3799 [Geobacillus proteiniphilus]